MTKVLKNNKIFSFILVLALVLGTSVTAFADTITPVQPTYPMTVTVQFEAEEETVTDTDDVDHNIPAIDVTKYVTYASAGAFSTEFPIDSGATHELEGYPTVMDAIYNAYHQYSPSMTGFSMGWDTYSAPNGVYITNLFGIGTITQDVTSNSWLGHSWSIYLNNNLINLYASNVQIENGDVVKVVYQENQENW